MVAPVYAVLMFKITRSQRPIVGQLYQPKHWWQRVRFKMSGDAWTNLITHHIWFYHGNKASFIKVVRTRTRYEVHWAQVRAIHAEIRRKEALEKPRAPAPKS